MITLTCISGISYVFIYFPAPKGKKNKFLPHTPHFITYQQSNHTILFWPASTDLLILLGLVVQNRVHIAGRKASFVAHGVPSIMQLWIKFPTNTSIFKFA